MRINTIFVDLDEVLADFVSAAAEVHGLTRAKLESRRTPGSWDITDAIGINHNKFWEEIHKKGVGFWVEILPTNWFNDVINLMEKVEKEFEIQWFVLSAPSRSVDCIIGKYQWIKDQIGRIDKLICTKHKHLLAKPDAVLIDDRYNNGINFITGGGRSILFPNQGNYMWKQANDPMPYVTQELYKMLKESN